MPRVHLSIMKTLSWGGILVLYQAPATASCPLGKRCWCAAAVETSEETCGPLLGTLPYRRVEAPSSRGRSASRKQEPRTHLEQSRRSAPVCALLLISVSVAMVHSFAAHRTRSKMAAHLRRCCGCLLYTSPSPRDKRQSRMPSSA